MRVAFFCRLTVLSTLSEVKCRWTKVQQGEKVKELKSNLLNENRVSAYIVRHDSRSFHQESNANSIHNRSAHRNAKEETSSGNGKHFRRLPPTFRPLPTGRPSGSSKIPNFWRPHSRFQPQFENFSGIFFLFKAATGTPHLTKQIIWHDDRSTTCHYV